jgi:hypothetical protein
MKKQVLVLTAFVLLALALVVPLHSAFAKSTPEAGASSRVGAAQLYRGQVSANSGASLLQSKPSKAPALKGAPADCSNDTADGAKVNGATDTDNVELQCGDQSTADGAGVNSATGATVKPTTGTSVKAAIGAKANSATGAKAKSATRTKVKPADSTGDPDNVDQQVEETGGPQGSTPGAAGK